MMELSARVPHLLCLVLPLTVFAFVATAPHPWFAALPWLLVIAANVTADVYAPPERRQPARALPAWPFAAILYLLAALQFVNLALLARMVAAGGFWRADTFVGFVLAGVNSGYSALVVAHELIHRSQRHRQLLGRALLCTVLYEHFYTEHLRGHHARVGREDDPATARFGETALGFLVRTVPAQFRSAWRLEAKRLGDERMGWWDRRLARSRVVRGLIAEWSGALAILALCGPGAFALVVLQAVLAVRLLEAVNYIEHWGLQRVGRRVEPVDSWDTESWFTFHALVGLSRHADHHVEAARPYQQLRLHDQAPKLPYGYFGSVLLAILANRRFRERMTAELERRRLGPFAPAAVEGVR
jgi:alkane 1-monooxygenase